MDHTELKKGRHLIFPWMDARLWVSLGEVDGTLILLDFDYLVLNLLSFSKRFSKGFKGLLALFQNLTRIMTSAKSLIIRSTACSCILLDFVL